MVVKPVSSTFSHHVTLNINDEMTLKKAINVAKIIDCGVIVERFILGDVHRMMCVGEEFIVCSKRLRASVVGDGKSTISDLIDKLNENSLRGNTERKGAALYQIKKEEQLTQYLDAQGLTLNVVLEKEKKVYLSDKSNCSNGAEVINLTEKVCDENIQLFKKLHMALGIAVSAIDFICEDVTQPWHSQSFAFLENNSFPAIDPQHYPSTGASVDVAKAIWDLVLEYLDTL